jgi:hypothetical protein
MLGPGSTGRSSRSGAGRFSALGISEETFDRHVRPHLPVVRLGTVRLYPISGLDRFLAQQASVPANDVRMEAA